MITFHSIKATIQNIIFLASFPIKKLLDPEKLLIINDHLDIAMDVADGVHLGREDYPLERARNLISDNFILGATCHNVEEAQFAVNAGASYLSVGCLFPTLSKQNTTPTSLSVLKTITEKFQIPICAVGGINEQNLNKVLSCVVDIVAVLSAVWGHECKWDQILKFDNLIKKNIPISSPFYSVFR